MKTDSTEEKRLKLQKEVDASKSTAYRNKHGQYATPPILANSLLAYAREQLGDTSIRFFDPAFGTGSFFTAAMNNFSDVKGLGIEYDADYFKAAKDIWSKHPELEVKKADFTASKPDFKANLVVCNPPYSRHHHLDNEIKSRLKKTVRESIDVDISGLAGLHAYFMLLAHQWLDENGLAVWLIPSEIVEVNYGKVIRDYLLDRVTLERIHFFEQQDLQFNDALVSSCVIVFKNSKAPKDHLVEVTTGDFGSPSEKTKISADVLRREKKWSKHMLLKTINTMDAGKIGDIFSVKRGIATGDNSFFILEKDEAEALKIPREFLKNVIPPSRYLKDNVIKLDKDGYLATEKKLVLLNISLPIDEIQAKYPKLYEYLRKGEESGVSEKYLASRRSPWYSQELREPPVYFVRYMTRERKNDTSHMLFIKNESDAIATNSYLMLYEKPLDLFNEAIDKSKVWDFLSNGINSTLYRYGRTYGGGLVKFEPSELKEIPIASSFGTY